MAETIEGSELEPSARAVVGGQVAIANKLYPHRELRLVGTIIRIVQRPRKRAVVEVVQ